MVKSAKNPGGTSLEAFDKLRAAVQADRSQFWRDLSMPFYGYNRQGANVSEGVRESFWLQGMMCGFPGAYFALRRFPRPILRKISRKSTCRRWCFTVMMTK